MEIDVVTSCFYAVQRINMHIRGDVICSNCGLETYQWIIPNIMQSLYHYAPLAQSDHNAAFAVSGYCFAGQTLVEI